MKAILNSMWVDTSKFTLEDYQPEEKNCFILFVNLNIGPANETGSDYFSIQICTPEWLCKNHWTAELMRHTLLVRQYDLEEIKNVITNYIDLCDGENWMEIAQKLSRVFAWEFEDYSPYE
ncbi:immunity 8 family protein [Thorsellia anophelis]|uniref:Immunity protein 8 n=1 Tax=Thorsellia anophelis DSM 18579 TaxID=1123402 RepID=A0A1I0ER29_9GAMM|nr:immunity 8 family protein [Thorsellia anophelis]SET47254.1 Immunity protein 8 [Thorsellia anophelis DSM 18579]